MHVPRASHSRQARRMAVLNIWAARALAVGMAAGVASGCEVERPVPDGSCTLVPESPVTCGDAKWLRDARPKDAPIASNEALGLAVYTCTGSARPDDSARYVEGVPQGLVCADRPAAGAAGATLGGERTYCCTTATGSCAYNPVASCEGSNTGFQCLGANRPEALNPALNCGNGVVQGDFLNYCCSGTEQTDGCVQNDSVGCGAQPGLMGFVCSGDSLPKGEQLGANKSRADFYRLLCPTAIIGGDGSKKYCCYMPALPPVGGSCVQHTNVPGCAPKRFGFACYGPDTPDQNYIPMHCPEPGVPGLSADGYPATLYCCDYQ
jgi:hypothetical protein